MFRDLSLHMEIDILEWYGRRMLLRLSRIKSLELPGYEGIDERSYRLMIGTFPQPDQDQVQEGDKRLRNELIGGRKRTINVTLFQK